MCTMVDKNTWSSQCSWVPEPRWIFLWCQKVTMVFHPRIKQWKLNGDQEASLFSSNICNLEGTLGGPGNCGNGIATWNGSQSSRGSGWEANSYNKVFSVFRWTQERHRLWQWPWQTFSPRTREGKTCLNCCTVNYFMKRWMKNASKPDECAHVIRAPLLKGYLCFIRHVTT